jgi:hypothetical protein
MKRNPQETGNLTGAPSVNLFHRSRAGLFCLDTCPFGQLIAFVANACS